MASFYPSEGDMLPTAYLLNQKLASYPSPELDNSKAYLNQPSVPLSYQNLLSGVALSAQPESIGSRDDTAFTPPTSVPMLVSDAHMLSKEAVHSDGSELMQQNYGLSLTLGCEEPLHSDLNPYTNSSLCSLLSSDVQSELQLCQNNSLKNVQYLSFDLGGRSQDAVNYGASFGSKGADFMPYLQQAPDFPGTICNSKYLKAVQDLLDEIVSVRGAPKLSAKVHNSGHDGCNGTDVKRDQISAEIQESTNTNSRDLSPSDRHDLQNKVVKLSDMLEEVNRRYRQYCHQMQVVVSSFDALAGRGAARQYTALALRTISCQFGSLRDAIKKQILVAQKSLGEQDANPHGVLTRLRNMDQQLRQQKALQQFGVMRQPWRPQRGLPESAVTVLRSWLFEHFLHPYPKDSEKIVLARQTGLTRSQVANWFINARVRLWKPMIEEMYKEEFGDIESDSKSSPELATTTQETSVLDEKEDEIQGIQQMQSNGTRRNVIASGQTDADRTGLSYENVAFQGW